MAIHEEHELVLTKLTERRLQPAVVERNRDAIVAGVNNKSLYVSGWLVGGTEKFENEPDPSDNYDIRVTQGWRRRKDVEANWRFQIVLTATFHREDGKLPDPRAFGQICRKIDTGAAQPKVGRWELTHVDGEDWEPTEEVTKGDDDDTIEYAPVHLPENWNNFFDHLYGLDHPIKIVEKAVTTAVNSNWVNRFNVALIGPPGCGKTDICRTVRRMLGEDAVLELDATAITAAGVQKLLTEIEILPRCIVIEEIEKVKSQDVLSFLLSLLDQRAEIRKITARSSIQRDIKLWAIATVNNYKLFKRIASGALASRFNHPVFFRRPNRAQLEMILEREVDAVNGNKAWVPPTLDYCDKHRIADPRRAIGICLSGADDLLTGVFQEALEATSDPSILEETSDAYEETDGEIDLTLLGEDEDEEMEGVM